MKLSSCTCRSFPTLASVTRASPNFSIPQHFKSSLSTTRSKQDGGRRQISNEMIFRTKDGKIKVDLTNKNIVGLSQSRGERPYQEDTAIVTSILIDTKVLKRNLSSLKGSNNGTISTELEGYSTAEDGKKQVAMFGVFDGHGGSFVSNYLKDHLPSLLEQGSASDVRGTIKEYRNYGGYLKRYRGGILERFREKSADYDERDEMGIGLDEVCVLGFLQADNAVLATTEAGKSGSVGTVALLHSLSDPSVPYQISPLILLTIAHLGDTTALLASTTGRVTRLTQNHHPDSRIESIRLRQSGTGIVTDSFGESRWGGTLANTRGVGDREFKTQGVIAEPEVTAKVIQGAEYSFLILLSDGITDSMSDQEVVDLCRGHSAPSRAAAKVVQFAEDVGGEDNLTALVVPLPGWKKLGGVDTSAGLREYRLRQGSGMNRSKRM